MLLFQVLKIIREENPTQVMREAVAAVGVVVAVEEAVVEEAAAEDVAVAEVVVDKIFK